MTEPTRQFARRDDAGHEERIAQARRVVAVQITAGRDRFRDALASPVLVRWNGPSLVRFFNDVVIQPLINPAFEPLYWLANSSLINQPWVDVESRMRGLP